MNAFLRQVVVSRWDIGIRKWTMWFREYLSSWPYAWLRPDFVPPFPFLVVKDPQAQSSRVLVEPHLIDAEFRKAWIPSSVGLVILLLLLTSSWSLLGIFCLKNHSWIFPGLLDGTCRRWHVPRGLQQEGWMGGLGTRLRRCCCLGFQVWLFFWNWLRPLVSGHRSSGCLYCHDPQGSW